MIEETKKKIGRVTFFKIVEKIIGVTVFLLSKVHGQVKTQIVELIFKVAQATPTISIKEGQVCSQQINKEGLHCLTQVNLTQMLLNIQTTQGETKISTKG